MMRAGFFAIPFLLLTGTMTAQDAVTTEPARKSAAAVRVPDGSIDIDGILDEESWQQATPITDFIQKEPVEGAAPTENMDVRVAYDDGALYIGARMFNSQETPIQAPLGRRDAVEQAEYILIHLDTFHDRRTAYAFGVTAAGVRIDRYYPDDNENNFDSGFDPVWQARTNIERESWTAELWIPFSQLRFNAQTEQVWGLNLQRSMPTVNEMDYWVPVPRTERVWASRFGDLRGINGIRSNRRIEVVPYAAGSSTMNGRRDFSNPFDDGRNLRGRTGADLKMGIGPNLTLEATVNPDFGQVEADPAEVNLSAFETFFSERRPFFTEGARLLNIPQVNNFFYSRRIGAPPAGPASGDHVDYPGTSTILGAAKLTGRLSSGTSIGMLAAVTDAEHARIFDASSTSIQKVGVAPRATFGVARVQQEFGPFGSTFSGMVSGVHRDLDAGDPLASLMTRSAFAAAGDSILRFKDGEYELSSFAGISFMGGEPAAIARVQRSSVHYFQRPDQQYSPYDPTRTSLTGAKAGTTFERTGGRHWLWSVEGEYETPGFNTNDMGRISEADGTRLNSRLRYRETTPGRLFRNYSIGVTQENEWNGAGDRQEGGLRAEANLTFLNFWSLNLETGPNFATLDQKLARGGPLVRTPRGWFTGVDLSSRPSGRTLWNMGFSTNRDEAGGRALDINGGITFRPGSQWQLSINPGYNRQTDSQQYVTTLAGGRPETFGQRYVFSYIDRNTWSTQVRLGYTLKPDMNIDVYAEPFAASGRYYDFGELAAPGVLERRLYGTDGTTVDLQPDGSRLVTDGPASFNLRNSDFNIRSFRSNIVFRWEWRPGSTLYLVWQQDRRLSEALGEGVGIGDMFRSLGAPGSNFFAVKMSFWVPLS